MNIAFFTETYFPEINGVTYTIDNWRQELERRGHNVYIVYPNGDHGGEAAHEVPIPSVKFRPVDGYYIGVSFPSDIQEKLPDIDVVHAHGQFSMGILAARVAKKEDAPLMLSYHTPGEQYFDYVSQNGTIQKLMDKIYLGWERFYAKRCDLILAPTEDASQRLENRIRYEVQELSNGVNTQFFAPQSAEAIASFRERYGIEDGPVIGYCGRLGYEKRLEDLVQFADRFEGEIVVAGDGFAKEHYLPMFESADITYLGRLDRDEMPTFYSQLDAFVLPSIAETQGVSVLEANACGTPAVGADAEALKNTINTGVNGFRYAPGDIDELECRITETLENQNALQQGARQTASTHSIESVITMLEEMYAQIQQ